MSHTQRLPARPDPRTLSAQAMRASTEAAVALLKSLASGKRLMILCQLVEGECAVGDLAKRLALSQSVVSQHLSLLRREGIVRGRRDGQSILYSISDERTLSLMHTLFELFCANQNSNA
jgi:DNA-binding transcriptional ArsR family regulator